MIGLNISQKVCEDFCEKNFSGLHHPFSELAPRLPPHPFGAKRTLIVKRLQHRNDPHGAETTPKIDGKKSLQMIFSQFLDIQ